MDDAFHDYLVQEGELPDLFDLNIESMLAEADQLLRDTKRNLLLEENPIIDPSGREPPNLPNRTMSQITPNNNQIVPIVEDDEVIFMGTSKVKSSDLPCVDLCTPRNLKRRRDRKLASNIIPCDTIDLDIYQSTSYIIKDEKLRKSEVTETQSTSGSLLKCPVCYDLIKHNAASTICGHVFCEICIKKSVSIAKKCPLCNRKLTPKNIHPLYLNF